MNNRRGDVVILDYPFSDSSGTKVRPALIVQTDHPHEYDCCVDHEESAAVTTDPTQLLIDISTPEGQQSGLHANSAVACGNLYTVHERHIIKTIGLLPAVLLRQANACLKTALDLP